MAAGSGVNVGGINLAVGVDLSSFDKGIEEITKTLKKFKENVKKEEKSFSLDFSVKQDPLKTINKTVDMAYNKLDSLFTLWKKGIGEVDLQTSKLGKRSTQVVSQIGSEYKKAYKELNTLRGKIPSTGEEFAGMFPWQGLKPAGKINILKHFGYEPKQSPLGQLANQTIGQDFPEKTELIKKLRTMEGMTRGVNLRNERDFLKGFRKDIEKEIELTGKEMEAKMKKLIQTSATIWKAKGAPKEKAFIDLESDFRQGFKDIKKYDMATEYVRNTRAVLNEEEALRRKLKILEKLKVAENLYKTEMEAGVNVERNRAALIKNYEKRAAMGVTLSQESLDDYRKQIVERGKLETKTPIVEARRAGELELDGKITEAKKRLSIALHELSRAEAVATANIKTGMDVDNNRIKLISILNEKLKVRGYLTKEEQQTLRQTKTDIYVNEIKNAQDVTKVLEKKLDILRQLKVAETQYRTELEAGVNIEKSREGLINTYRQRAAQGVKLNQRELDDYKKQLIEKGKLPAKDPMMMAEREAELRLAGSTFEVQKRRSAMLHQLSRDEAQLRAELSQNYMVDKNRIKLIDLLIQKKQIVGHLTTKETEEISRLSRQVRKYNEEVQKQKGKDEGGFFSETWLRNRARWFLQLRGYWAVYRVFADATQQTLQFEQEMANLQAITQTTGKYFDELKEKALDVGRSTKFSAVEAAEAMVVLGQAGLSTKQILSSISDIANLSAATLFDFKKSAELVTTIMYAWGMESSRVKEITDILATSINNTRLTMEALSVGMNYLAGIAPQLNLSLQDTNALFGTLVNRGINASVASTSLRGVLAELEKPTKAFREELATIGLTLDDVDPKFDSVFNILQKLKKAGWDTENSFRAFERRVAMGANILIANSEHLKRMSESMHELDRALNMARTQLDTIPAQWKQFNDQLVSTMATLNEDLNPAFRTMIELLKIATKLAEGAIEPFVKLAGLSFKGWGDLLSLFYGKDTEKQKSLQSILANISQVKEFKLEEESILQEFTRLRDLKDQLRNTIFEAQKSGKGFNAAIDSAAMQGLTIKAEDLIGKSEEEVDKYLDELFAQLKQGVAERLTKLRMSTKMLETRGGVQIASFFEDEVESLKKVEEEYTKVETLLNRLSKSTPTWSKELEKLAQKALFPTTPTDQAPALSNWTSVEKQMKSTLEGFDKDLKERKARILLLWNTLNKETKDRLKDNPALMKILGLDTTTGKKNILEGTARTLKELEKNIPSVPYKGVQVSIDQQIKVKQLRDAELRDGIEMAKISMRKLNIDQLSGKELGEYKKLTGQVLKFEEERAQIAYDIIELQTRGMSAKDRDPVLDEAKRKKQLAEINAKTEADAQIEAGKKSARVYDATTIRMEEKELQFQAEKINRQKSSLKLDQLSNEELEKANKLEDELLTIAEQRADLEFERAKLQTGRGGDFREAEQTKIMAKEAAAEQNKLAKEQNKKSNEQYNRHRIQLEQQLKINALNKELFNIRKEDPNNLEDSLRKEMEIMDIERKRLLLQKDATTETLALLEILSQIDQQLLQIEEQQEKMKRASDPIYDAWQRIKEQVVGYNQFISDTLLLTFNELANGLTKVAFDATGGFQEQRQEVENLKGELEELQVEYEEAISEGNIARAAQLNNEMSDLKKEINDLEDPIHNLKEAFRDMFKDVIDGVREAIIQWLVMKALMAGFGGLMGGGAVNSDYAVGPMWSAISSATGGVLPHIESFKRFSRGGITSRPTLALLGDNRSGQELVIPSENIKSDQASGYVRSSKQPVNIVNVVTEQDFHRIMASQAGKNIIVNTVGQDMQKRGTTFRSYNM